MLPQKKILSPRVFVLEHCGNIREIETTELMLFDT
jgi:hypothetical protein